MERSIVVSKLKQLEPKLRDFGVGSLYLYGSHARDEASATSDVDVFVDATDEKFYALSPFVGAYEVIRAAFPDHSIDYGTRDGLSVYIRSTIEKEAVRVF
jgi:uncharacterized protein